MRIISKFKDYYDFLAGAKFGIDNKVVFDRRDGKIFWGEQTDNRNDIQKLESAGFNKKISFRH